MISIGIVGAGAVGERIIRQIQQEEGIAVEIVYDEQPARLEHLKSRYGVATAKSLDEVLHSGIDWIYIGTPPDSHASIAEKAASAGIHILSEKPLAHNAADGEKMLKSAEENQVNTAMHFPLMYSSAVYEMAKRIKSGNLGKIMRIELHAYFPEWPRAWQQNPWIASRSQGGFVREVFPHYLQLIQRIFGEWTILSHQIDYPENKAHCETGLIAHGKTAESIPVLLSGLSGMGQRELLQFKVYGERSVLTLENWSQLYASEPGGEPQPVTEIDDVPTLFQELVALSTSLVPFEEGLIVQRHIDQLLEEKI